MQNGNTPSLLNKLKFNITNILLFLILLLLFVAFKQELNRQWQINKLRIVEIPKETDTTCEKPIANPEYKKYDEMITQCSNEAYKAYIPDWQTDEDYKEYGSGWLIIRCMRSKECTKNMLSISTKCKQEAKAKGIETPDVNIYMPYSCKKTVLEKWIFFLNRKITSLGLATPTPTP